MATEKFIDYLQFSAFLSEHECMKRDYEIVCPIAFYRAGYRDEFGIRYYFGNPKLPTQCLVIMSGDTMQAQRDRGFEDADVLRWAFDIGAKFSRLDLAVTSWAVDNEKIITVSDVEEWYRLGLIVSPLAKNGGKLITGISVGENAIPETFYVGDPKKRGKRGIFRAYDKGIEMDLAPYLGTRLELELKRDKAHANAVRLNRNFDFSGNFRASFDVKHEDFDKLMEAPAIKIQRGMGKPKRELSEEMNRRWVWLLEQVAPAMREAIEHDKKNGDETRLGKFLVEIGVTKELSELVKNRIAFGLQQERMKRLT